MFCAKVEETGHGILRSCERASQQQQQNVRSMINTTVEKEEDDE